MGGNLNIRTWVGALCITCGLVPAFATNPLKTVPWNGYSGAASFTFDDGAYQVETLPKILEEMPDVKVTFFLSNMGVDLLHLYGKEFAQLAREGPEIGNHTNNHLSLPSLRPDSLETEVVDFADEIQNVMASYGADVNITAHALPYSANSETVSRIVNERHFINRSSWGSGRHSWEVAPKWMDVDSRAWYSWPNAEENLMKALDTAAYLCKFINTNSWYKSKESSWVVLLNHGVSYNGETHITPEAIRNAFQHALDNHMWVAPFSTVGAYYRAHFVLDAAEAKANGDKYTIKWKLPHPNMPKSIPMKVSLSSDFVKSTFGDSAIVLSQKGRIIFPDDGIYTIEFTDLELDICTQQAYLAMNKPQMMSSYASLESTEAIKTLDDNNQASGIFASKQVSYTLHDVNGKLLKKINSFEIPSNVSQGIYLIRAKAPGFKTVTRKVVH